ncbi:MAG TPA: type VI secretion system tube protein TssD [Fimbriimonadaceae bacterium]|nr:type VI secretion system tube protein TssD [Fimbriimonadaceae bacterium]
MKIVASLVAVTALLVAAAPAKAALNAYLLVTGAKQGKFKGTGRSKSGKIEVSDFRYGIVSPRDPQSGLPTGQRMHKPIIMTISAADGREFQTALKTNENLPAVQILFWRPSSAGKIEQYETLNLKDATVVKIEMRKSSGRQTSDMQITLNYQKIESSYSRGKVQAADDWKQ